MSFFYPNIVVTPANVAFGEVLGTLQAANDVGNEREGVAIFDGELVEFTIVLYKP